MDLGLETPGPAFEVQHRRSRLPRGDCPMCGRDVALRRRGEFREHRKPEGGLCPASGLTSEQIEDWRTGAAPAG